MIDQRLARRIVWSAAAVDLLLLVATYRYYRIVPALRFAWIEKTWVILLIIVSILLATSIAFVLSRKFLPAKPKAKQH